MNFSYKTLYLYLCLSILSSSLMAIDFVVPRLSPLPADLKKEMINLNGVWRFNTSPNPSFFTNPKSTSNKSIEVPGEWEMQGFKVDKGAAAGYVRRFDLPETWKGKPIKLRCNAIYSESVIYINGKEVGKHIGGFTAFEFDITKYVNYGESNQIAIRVICESKADALSNASNYAAHPIGGILRDIFIFPLSEANFTMFHVSTDFDENYENAILKTEFGIANEALTEKSNLQLKLYLKDANGQLIKQSMNTIKLDVIKEKTCLEDSIKINIDKPKHWTAETPYLYTFTAELWEGNSLVSQTNKNIGFREIEVRGNQVFVNNKPIKLRGVNRHEIMPLRGRSPQGDIWEKDVELFRAANVNYIRTSHYPPDEALLDACDKLGMYLEIEAPFCWAHRFNLDESENNDLLLINQHVEMVNRDRTHPSVLMWSLGNESLKYEEYFRNAGRVIKIMDPTRPRIFSEWGPDADKGDLEITNHHYPGPSGPSKYKDLKRPITFDEYCHLNSYNRFELSADPSLRNSFGMLLDQMWTDMYNTESVLGGALWSGIDDTFFHPNGGAYGYGTWGPIDGWRRPKPEYWNVKKAYSPVRIVQKSNISDAGLISFDIENRHDFTNLSDCVFEWKNGENKGNIHIDLEPRAKTVCDISIPQLDRNNPSIHLVVKSPLGFVIDEYVFQALPYKESFNQNLKVKLKVKENDKAININVGKSLVIFNKGNGLIDVRDLKNYLIIQNSPKLMLLPLNPEGRGIQMIGNDMNFDPFNPICTNWVAESFDYEYGKDLVRIKVIGTYKEAKGSLIYEISDSGKLSVEYDFTVLKDVNPRQVGLVFNLDKTFTSQNWKRKGYWSVYPENHLGALSGHVEAFNPNIEISGSAGPDKQPTVDWSFDQTSAGSNLFRATKENIYEASLLSNHLGRITIDSNGSQHFRAWSDPSTSTMKMLVADYNNPGGEGYLSSHSEKYYKPLKEGDKITGKASFFIDR